MSQVGNPGLTVNEQRAHFALWALFKSPLFIGADLRSLSKEAKEILLAPEVIAVNQDSLGVAGDLIWKQGPLESSVLHAFSPKAVLHEMNASTQQLLCASFLLCNDVL